MQPRKGSEQRAGKISTFTPMVEEPVANTAPRVLLGTVCGISVKPHLAYLTMPWLDDTGDAPCRVHLLEPTRLIGYGRWVRYEDWGRKETRLLSGPEAEAARRHISVDEHWIAGENALTRGNAQYAAGTETSLRGAIEQYRVALRHWKAVKDRRRYEETLDRLAATYAGLIVRLIELKDAGALRETVMEAAEFDAATGGNRLPDWERVTRTITALVAEASAAANGPDNGVDLSGLRPQ